MSTKKRNKLDREKLFLNRLAALTSGADDRDQTTLEDDLRTCGIDPAELRKVAHDRFWQLAKRNYISLGKDSPEKLKDLLRQLRPPTPDEEEQKQKSQAGSTITDLLANIRTGIASAVRPLTPLDDVAHAFRNKNKKLTQKDRDLLKAHQAEIDSESDDKNRDDH
jgi:hypothetical protein